MPVDSWGPTQITFSVPAGMTAGTYDVVVTVGGLASNAEPFIVSTGPVPTITELSMPSGPVGSIVALTGINFGAPRGSSTVSFAGTPVTNYSIWQDYLAMVFVPIGAVSGPIIITVNGVPSAGFPFVVTPNPELIGISPASGPVGTSVTLTGTYFGTVSNLVDWAGITAYPTSWEPTRIVVSVPAGAASGNVRAQHQGGVYSNAISFTVPAPAAPTFILLNTGMITFPNSSTRQLASICGGIIVPPPSSGIAGVSLFCQTAWYPSAINTLAVGNTVTISQTGGTYASGLGYDGTYTVGGLSTGPDNFGMSLVAP